MNEQATQEFDAMKIIHEALLPLEQEGRVRVLKSLISLLDIKDVVMSSQDSAVCAHEDQNQFVSEGKSIGQAMQHFSSFADLYDAADPQGNGEKALVAGYWLQECQKAENFAAAANKELNDLGRKILNITHAIDSMKNQKPALILQIKKSGSSKQARKLYKLSQEGIKCVQEMLRG
jgi:hypothetical protein